jgi:hypothetical protein
MRKKRKGMKKSCLKILQDDFERPKKFLETRTTNWISIATKMQSQNTNLDDKAISQEMMIRGKSEVYDLGLGLLENTSLLWKPSAVTA